MPTECVFTLPTGRKCRCMATRGHAFCRHHGAPRSPRRPVIQMEWNRLACWRSLMIEIVEGPALDLPGHIFTILQGLWQDEVSDRYAGRALRLILKRVNGIPLIIDQEYEKPAPAPPPPRAHLDPAKEAAERERVLRWGQSLFASLEARRLRLSADHARPSAPAQAAAR